MVNHTLKMLPEVKILIYSSFIDAHKMCNDILMLFLRFMGINFILCACIIFYVYIKSYLCNENPIDCDVVYQICKNNCFNVSKDEINR